MAKIERRIDDIRLEYIQKAIDEIKSDIKEIKTSAVTQDDLKPIRDVLPTFVTKEDFSPVKLIVYSIVGLILTGVIGALLTVVIKK